MAKKVRSASPLLSRADLSRGLGVHPDTVTEMVRRGQLPPPWLRLGRAGDRWRLADLADHLRKTTGVLAAVFGGGGA